MTFLTSKQLKEQKAVELWEQMKTVSEILKALGWQPNAGKHLLGILRANGQQIPYGLAKKELHDLTIGKVKENFGIASKVLKGTGEPDIEGMLKTQPLYLMATQDTGQFGMLRLYESHYTTCITLHKEDTMLILAYGRRPDVTQLLRKVEERFFKQYKQEDSQSTK